MTTAAVALTGWVRELVLANLFGVGTEMDAFYFSVALVQSVHDLLFAGTLTASIIPMLHRLDVERPAHERARFVMSFLVIAMVAGFAVAAILWLGMPNVIQFLAPNLPDRARDLTLRFSDLLVLSIPLNALVLAFVLVLNAHRRFWLAAGSYVVNNVAFIAIAAGFTPRLGPDALPVAQLGGPLCSIPLLAFQAVRLGIIHIVKPDFSRHFFAPLWRHSQSMLLSLGIGSTIGFLMVAQLIARSFAASHGPGAISALGYAFRLYEVPISLAANPAATMLFPMAASLFIAGEKAKLAGLTNAALLWGLIILFPAVVITLAGAEPIVHLIFEHGNFDHEATLLTAEALRGFSLAILGESVFIVFFRIFYAIHRPGWTVWIAALSLLILVLLLQVTSGGTLLFVALSVSVAFGFAAASILVLLVRYFGRGAVPDWTHILRWTCGAVTALVLWRLSLTVLNSIGSGEVIGLAAFSVAYALAMVFCLGSERRVLMNALGASAFSRRRG
jgi:putative peptidoglycan lipid II flippase